MGETLSFRLLIASNSITRPFKAAMGDAHDLQLADWRSMMALAIEPGLSGEDIANLLAMDKMTVSRALRRLEAQGRAKRSVSRTDKRRHEWTMTAKGWRIYDKIREAAMARDAMIFEGTSATERATIRRVMDRIIESGIDSTP